MNESVSLFWSAAKKYSVINLEASDLHLRQSVCFSVNEVAKADKEKH